MAFLNTPASLVPSMKRALNAETVASQLVFKDAKLLCDSGVMARTSDEDAPADYAGSGALLQAPSATAAHLARSTAGRLT